MEKQMIPHLKNDGHAVMAIGYMLAELEQKVNREEVATLPHPEEWLKMYERGVLVTRLAAGMEAGTGYVVAANPGTHVLETATPRTPKIDELKAIADERANEAMHGEPDPVPAYTTGDGTPFADADATSNNLVSLMPCSVEGCNNQIPTTKSMAVCHEHEPKLDEGAELPVD